MLTAEQVARFKTDGFVKGGRVIDDQTVEALRSELTRVIDEQSDPKSKKPVSLCNISHKESPIWQVVNIWEASEPFRQLTYNKQICEEVAQLTNATQLRVWHDQVQYKPREKAGRTCGTRTALTGPASCPRPAKPALLDRRWMTSMRPMVA